MELRTSLDSPEVKKSMTTYRVELTGAEIELLSGLIELEEMAVEKGHGPDEPEEFLKLMDSILEKIAEPEELPSTVEGHCPICDSSGRNIKWHDWEEHEDGSKSITYTCKMCGFEGMEHYSEQFVGHTDADGNEIEK